MECHPDFDFGIERFSAFFNRLGNEENPINAAIRKALEGGRMYRTRLSHLEPHNRHAAWWVASGLVWPERHQAG